MLLFVVVIRVAGAQEKDISFAVIADHTNSFTGLENALEFINSLNIDFIIVAGDIDPIETNHINLYATYDYTVGSAYLSNRQEIYFALGNHGSPRPEKFVIGMKSYLTILQTACLCTGRNIFFI
jgi:hypothetical protein